MYIYIFYLILISHNTNQETFNIPNTKYEIDLPLNFTIQNNHLKLRSPLVSINFIVLDNSLFKKENPTKGFALEDSYPGIKKFPVNSEYSLTDIILHYDKLDNKTEIEPPHIVWIAKTDKKSIISTITIQDLIEEKDLNSLINNISIAFSTLRKIE